MSMTLSLPGLRPQSCRRAEAFVNPLFPARADGRSLLQDRRDGIFLF
jgi:hypothetical protein